MYLYPDNVHFASTVDLVGGPSLTFKLHRINIFPTYDYVRITNGKLSPGNGNETQLSEIDPLVLRNSYEKREEKIRLKRSIEA